MLGNDGFVWCCQGVASENVASRKSLAMLSCGVLGALLGGIAGYLLGVYYLSPICPSQEPGWRPSLLFPSYFRKTWHTILLAVCLVLRRETCPKAQNTICVGHCPDTAIHDNTSLLVSVSSLDSRWFSFSPAGSVPWHLGMCASQRWASRLHSPCTAMVEWSCGALRAALDVNCINPGTAPYQGWPRPDVVDFFAWRLWKSSKMTVVPSSRF